MSWRYWVLITQDEDTPSDAEFAALRDMLLNDVGEGTTQGFPDSGEANSIVPKDATSVHFSNKVVILSNALRYIQLSRRPQLAFAPREHCPWLDKDNICLENNDRNCKWLPISFKTYTKPCRVGTLKHAMSLSQVDSLSKNPAPRNGWVHWSRVVLLRCSSPFDKRFLNL
jgi:hypothetical protein